MSLRQKGPTEAGRHIEGKGRTSFTVTSLPATKCVSHDILPHTQPCVPHQAFDVGPCFNISFREDKPCNPRTRAIAVRGQVVKLVWHRTHYSSALRVKCQDHMVVRTAGVSDTDTNNV